MALPPHPGLQFTPAGNVPAAVKTGPNLRYPIDDIEKHFGKITFKIVDEDAARLNIGQTLASVANGLREEKTFRQQIQDDADRATDAILDDYAKRVASTNRSVADEASSYRLREDTLVADPSAGSVALFLPQNIQIQDGVTYDNFELGRIGAAAESALNLDQGNLQGAIASAGGELAGQIGDVLALIRGTGNVGPGIASLAAQSATPRTISSAISSATGIATNPNVRTLFRQVPIRNFNFTFELIPSSATEAQQIKDIIKFFRTELYPSALALQTGTNYGYRFPNRFLIKMKYRNKADPDGSFNGIKFLPVYLQTFNAVYNTAGQALHSDGNFQSASINMNFIESRPLNRQDVEEYGY